MNKKTVLITGGTKGIGRALVHLFSEHNYNIITCGRSTSDLDDIKAELTAKGIDHYVDTCDVRSYEAVKAFVDKATSSLGTIDCLINNVGIFIPGKIQEESLETFKLTMETNLDGTYYFSKATIPYLKKSSKPHIFNMCSVASIRAYPNGGSYGISKYAQYGLTKILREELIEDQIAVTAVLPGATRTGSWDGTDLPDSRFIAPESVAKTIFNIYEMPQDSVVEDIVIRPMEGDI